ncbi:alpha/beta fold hydrolase [Streptomyces sp. NPDC012825]|uniref:alpha/beta fold hydrolase n=1 Tax=Streptomyces sp. NPDC012825 TaxID=3364851 RepID=UPI0036C2C8E7
MSPGNCSAPAPVVLLHALFQDSSMWEAQKAELTRRGHRVVAPDQRGFGRNPLGDSAPCMDLLADDVVRTLDKEGIDRAAFFGSSMGGYVAMAVLRRHPDRVLGLGLLASRATADPPADRANREKTAEQCLDGTARQRLYAQILPALVGATTHASRPAVISRTAQTAHRMDPRSVAWALRAVADRPCSLALLHETQLPALVVAGAEDRLVGLDEMRLAASALRRGQLVTIPDAGHLPPLETPAPVTRAIHGLLTEIPC